jgi:NADH-quinone oxidoreductase subunit E
LIPALQAVQRRLGYLPQEALRRVAQHCQMPESTVFGVASFYAQFRLKRQGRHSVKICQGTCCHIRGGMQILEAIQRELGIRPGETTADHRFSLQGGACFGACASAPAMMVDGRVYGTMTPSKALKLVRKLK